MYLKKKKSIGQGLEWRPISLLGGSKNQMVRSITDIVVGAAFHRPCTFIVSSCPSITAVYILYRVGSTYLNVRVWCRCLFMFSPDQQYFRKVPSSATHWTVPWQTLRGPVCFILICCIWVKCVNVESVAILRVKKGPKN